MESDEGQSYELGLVGSEDLKVQRIILYNSNSGMPADCIHTQSSDPRKWSMKPQKVIRSRDRKFHKRFKNLPESEKVLKVYHCAYVSDILLQGYLYITTDTFCFYSKILGRERQIEIPISEVIDVTREKTAFIIPNAIGIQTSDSSKYVFGSLVSRNRTYRLIFSLWKRVGACDRFAASRLSCDSRMRKYERNRSRSSAEKTSSDESYFTEPEQPMPCPPLASPYPSSPSPLLRRKGSAVTHGSPSPPPRPLLADSSVCRHDGYAPSSSSVRRTSNLAPAHRSPSHGRARKHSNAEYFCVEKEAAPNRIGSLTNFLNGITPTGWWAIACTALTCMLTLYGFVVFWKVLHLQNDIVFRLYQLSLNNNNRETHHSYTRYCSNISNLYGKIDDISDLINDYSVATERLLVATKNLQSILQSNAELIMEMCRIMTSVNRNNNNNKNKRHSGTDKADCS